jgi:hypothetical protein
MGDVYRALVLEVFGLLIVATATVLAIAAVRRRRRALRSEATTAADRSPNAERDSKGPSRDVPSRTKRAA